MPSPSDVLQALARDPEARLLSMRELQVISIVCAERDPAKRTAYAIGIRLSLTRNAMTRVGHRLEDLGLIIRALDPANNVRTLYIPTERAHTLDRRVRAAFEREAVA